MQGASLAVQWVKNPPALQEMQETWVQFLGWEDLLEEGILAWRIPRTEECGRPPWSIGSQKVRHTLSNRACMHTRERGEQERGRGFIYHKQGMQDWAGWTC